MSRRMDYTLTFDAPAEKIYQDFTSREYWEALMDSYRPLLPQSEITTFVSDERGTDIVFLQYVPRSFLPALARKFIRVDMAITRSQHFDPYDHDENRATGTYAASIPHGPGQFGGEYFLSGNAGGSQLQLASECKVWIPLAGGALEDLILHGIKDLFDSEEAFTADWVTRRH